MLYHLPGGSDHWWSLPCGSYCRSPIVLQRGAVHVRGMVLYRADIDGIEVVPALPKAAKHSEKVVESAPAIRDIREVNGSIDIQIEWDGLPDDFELSWEPMCGTTW